MKLFGIAIIYSSFVFQVFTGKTPLYIGGFYPLTKDFSSWGQGCKPAAELAVQHINNRSDLLDDYELVLLHMDTQGSPGVASRELFRLLQNDPVKIMLLGPFPSHIAMAVADTVRWWNLVQVSPAAFTPELSNRPRFPFFFRTRAALTSFNEARIAFIRHFGWKRVAIITWQTNYFTITTDFLYKDLHAANISVVTTEVFQENYTPREEMERIKTLNARIIFVLAYEEKARSIFCEAHRLGMIGRKYVYILHYGNDPWWMTQHEPIGGCTKEQIEEAADGHFITRDVTLREDGVLPLAGLTTTEFINNYTDFAMAQGVVPAVFYAPLTYDAVWSIALALNASQPELAAAGKPLENFTYEDIHMTGTFMKHMGRLSFEGMSGLMTFSETGDVGALQTKFQRFRKFTSENERSYVTLGYHDATTGSFKWVSGVQWQGDRVPFDDIKIVEVTSHISSILFYIMVILALCGMILSFIFLWFNLSHRHSKFIRMSSPNLNNMIIAGCILSYTSIIFHGLDKHQVDESTLIAGCHVKIVLLAVGYSLGFGSLFAKTWRVFKIFTNKSMKRLVIQDHQLGMMVFGFLLVDAFYFTLWFSVDRLYLEHVQLPIQISEDDPDINLVPAVERCASSYEQIWQLCLLAIKGVFLIFGVFLAWQTRHVSIPALNDSKYIGFSVYNITVVCLLGVPASFILVDSQFNALYAITAACIFVGTTITQCIVFLPKMIGFHTGRVETDTQTQRSATQSTGPAPSSIS